MAERPPIGLAMLCTMSLSVSGTDALSGLNGAMPWLNKSVPPKARLRNVTINAIGLCWGGWAPCWNDPDVCPFALYVCVRTCLQECLRALGHSPACETRSHVRVHPRERCKRPAAARLAHEAVQTGSNRSPQNPAAPSRGNMLAAQSVTSTKSWRRRRVLLSTSPGVGPTSAKRTRPSTAVAGQRVLLTYTTA